MDPSTNYTLAGGPSVEERKKMFTDPNLWLHSGQKVEITAPCFSGQTGEIDRFFWATGEYMVKMDETGHTLPFVPSQVKAI